MVSIDADVAIVGGGPAGSTLAALLAERGVVVTVIERDTFPRDKLCGEFLSYDALPIVERIGLDLSKAAHIHACRIVGRHRSYQFELPHAARGISRERLDADLACAAATRGATIVSGTALASLDDIRASVVVGAWGRWSRFDKDLGRAFVRERTSRSFGFKRHYRGPSNDGVISLYSFDHGYMGINDVEEGVTNICGLVDESRLSGHKGRWDTFVESIRADEPAVDAAFSGYAPAQESFLTSNPVVFRARCAVDNGVFMIGDASGVIDPLAGNGMAMAIQSALVAAPCIMKLLSHPDRRDAIEREYSAAHGALFIPRITWSRRVAALLSRPALLDLSLRGAHGPTAGSFLVRKTRGDREAFERRANAWFDHQG